METTRLEEWSLTRKVRDPSSGESESHREEPRAVRKKLMKPMCHTDREQTKTRLSGKLHGSTSVCEKTLQCRGEMVVVATGGRD